MADLAVNALVMSADGSKVIAGGAFQTINGSEAYGMGAIDPSTGALLPWLTTQVIRNAGAESAILSLTHRRHRHLRHRLPLRWRRKPGRLVLGQPHTGELIWVEDCHGDTYERLPGAEAVYTVSHAHYCGNVGGFPQTDPWSFSYALAWSKNATGTVSGPDPLRLPRGQAPPAPSMISWFPG